MWSQGAPRAGGRGASRRASGGVALQTRSWGASHRERESFSSSSLKSHIESSGMGVEDRDAPRFRAQQAGHEHLQCYAQGPGGGTPEEHSRGRARRLVGPP